MNYNHVQQIFYHYIEKFEYVNVSEHQEYYKWQIIDRFHDEMDKALATPAEELSAKLYEIKKLSANLIDNYTQPFHGLVKFAEKEPETVREMFKNLYADDGGNIEKRRLKVVEFLNRSHSLRDKYFPDSYLYKDDMHSVTGYLFLYDPDHNYIFKAAHAQIFADCIEFCDDWGSGDNVDLKIYYRMCDQLVQAIKDSKELMATDASRFEDGRGVDPSTFYPDPEKHILAFDLIYCCSTYGLFDGITFVRPKSKERQLMHERKDKAVMLAAKLDEARKKLEGLEEAEKYVGEVYTVGKTIHHRAYGDGKITAIKDRTVTVNFGGEGEKLLGLTLSVANGIISIDEEGYEDKMKTYRDLLKKDNSIRTGVSYAEKEFAPYSEYLE